MDFIPVAGDFYPRRINQYCPKMQMAADVNPSGVLRTSLGTPAVADTDGLLDGVDTTATSGTITVTGNANLGAIGAIADSPFGRNVTVTGAGAGSKVLTINGFDYLGQPMSETITCTTGNGTGVKAFYEVTSITLGAVAGDSDSDFGWGAQLGLPYMVQSILLEVTDGTPEASVGTLTAPVLTDPQTATTGDPRGTYAPNVTLDGSTEVVVHALVQGVLSASGNGGLQGVSHYAA